MELGQRIRERRKVVGVSQETLAHRAGVTVNVINRIERGVVTDPHYSTLSGVADALGTSIGDLVGEEPAAPKVTASPTPEPESEVAGEERRDTRMFRMAARFLEGQLNLLKNGDISGPEAAGRLTEYSCNTIIGELAGFVIAGYPESAKRWIVAIDEKLDELYAATERIYREAEETELDQRHKDELRRRRLEKQAEREQAARRLKKGLLEQA